MGFATLMLLALGLLPLGLLQHLAVFGGQDLQGGLRAPSAPGPGPTLQGLLLDGQQRAGLRQVAVAQLLLDEAMQDSPRRVFQCPHAAWVYNTSLDTGQTTWKEGKKSNQWEHVGRGMEWGVEEI